nr:pyocin activator PrtN family protein [uncultured Pseudogulbenkiania sp.]
MSRTAFLLMAQYEKPLIPLESAAADFLGISARLAKERAATGTLPFPTMRLTDSQKAPRLVHVDDLAKWIDETREDARKQWERSQV